MSVLERLYEDSLDSIVGVREQIAKEFALEDEFHEFVQAIIRKTRHTELRGYSGRMSFTGEARNVVATLDLAATPDRCGAKR